MGTAGLSQLHPIMSLLRNSGQVCHALDIDAFTQVVQSKSHFEIPELKTLWARPVPLPVGLALAHTPSAGFSLSCSVLDPASCCCTLGGSRQCVSCLGPSHPGVGGGRQAWRARQAPGFGRPSLHHCGHWGKSRPGNGRSLVVSPSLLCLSNKENKIFKIYMWEITYMIGYNIYLS